MVCRFCPTWNVSYRPCLQVLHASGCALLGKGCNAQACFMGKWFLMRGFVKMFFPIDIAHRILLTHSFCDIFCVQIYMVQAAKLAL